MRRLIACVVALCVLFPGSATGRHNSQPPPGRTSPPGQLHVMTVNARQFAILDLGLFTRLYELVRAVRTRPPAFDGGGRATAVPDVIVFQELRFSNLEIFDRILDQNSPSTFEIVTVEGADARFLINSSEITLASEPQTILDPCRDGSNGEPAKQYIWARFTENATGAPFVVVGVHLKAQYDETGQQDCVERNIDAIRDAVAAETAPVVVAGDFNKRAMSMARECDPDERSEPLPWWSMLTAPTDGSRAFVDAVQSFHRASGDVMTHEWTFERRTEIVVCNGDRGLKRTRLDYIFTSGLQVAKAHADHPGWAGEPPGTTHAHNPRYSDHRFVWGRFILSGPPQPAAPTATPAAGGVVDLAWQPQEGVTEWVVYRSSGRRKYVPLARVPAETTTYRDTSGFHGVVHHYAIAPVGLDGGQGLESNATTAIPDARGPRVIGRRPAKGAAFVRRWVPIDVFFDERIDPASVTDRTISVYRKGIEVRGNAFLASGRRVRFNPFFPLRKKTRYWVVVRPTSDALGNRGERDVYSFTTK